MTENEQTEAPPWAKLYPTPWEAKNRGHDWQVVAANGLTVAYFAEEWKARLFAAGPDMACLIRDVRESGGNDLPYLFERMDAAMVKAARAQDFKKVVVFLCIGCHVPRTTVDESGKCKECRGRSA